ncbi:MAG: hypothetical protein ACREXX_13910 [Gammaproteobacteria bacterium]
MNPPLAVNSRCRTCSAPVLWAELPSGKSVPLDRNDAGPVRLIRADHLRAEFLSGEELRQVFDQQRAARDRGQLRSQVVEQLYSVHNPVCRAAARSTRRPRRRRKGARR